MGLFGPQRVPCPAGVWTTILDTRFRQIPAQDAVKFEGDVVGEFEETKSAWIFPGTPRTGPLAGKRIFDRGSWNTFYRVRVRPERDVVAIVD